MLDKILDKKLVIPVSINIRFSYSISVVWLLFLATIPYLLWEIYWATKVRYGFIKWHTHIMLYVYVWFIGYFLLYYIVRRLSYSLYSNLLTSFSFIMFTLTIVEMVLFSLGINKTYLEKRGNKQYSSRYGRTGESWYRTPPPNQARWLTTPEFNYARTTNSLGFSDPEWPVVKSKSEKRILALGDSFTEGDGAPYDSSYVALLRQKFKLVDSDIYVMNAGICGDDPFVNFVCYRDKLFIYQPDIIVQTLSCDDLDTDIETRGGMERFIDNKKTCYHKGPWWEPIYALSYISRLFFTARGYNELLVKGSIIQDKEYLDKTVIGLFKDYAALAKKNNCKLMVTILPDVTDIAHARYAYDFTHIINELGKVENLVVYDLLPFYVDYVKKQNKPLNEYYWTHDGHPNSTGYAMMADGVYAGIDSLVYK